MTLIDKLLQHIRINKAIDYIPVNSVILDIGSSDGELFEFLNGKLKTGIGIDPLLKENVLKPSYTLLKGLFPQDVPANIKFDSIVLLATFEHLDFNSIPNIDSLFSSLLNEKGLLIITVPSSFVDHILKILKFFRLVHAETLDEHHGFESNDVLKIIGPDYFELIVRKRFELNLNNLFVFRKKNPQ